MKKCALLLVCAISSLLALAQKEQYKKPPTLGIMVGFYDFKSPQIIAASSFSTVLKDKNWAKVKNMGPALGLRYIQGFTNHIDVSASLWMSSVDYFWRDKNEYSGVNGLLTELDASGMFKLLSDKYFLTPYATAGVGISAYQSKLDAFMPVGLGLQFKLSDEAFLFVDTQSRMAVTERASKHFVYSLSFANTIGDGKKAERKKPLP